MIFTNQAEWQSYADAFSEQCPHATMFWLDFARNTFFANDLGNFFPEHIIYSNDNRAES